MVKRFIRIAAAALAALSLAGGCARTADPSADQAPREPIRIDAGSLLLQDDGALTKAGDDCVLKEGDFVAGQDAIAVYATRQGNGSQTLVFDGTVVSKNTGGWVYEPLKLWDWQTEGDQYDFIGVYPASGVQTSRTVSAGTLALVTPYSLLSPADTYDLLYAVTRRLGNESNRHRTVELAFKHMLSAVRVVVHDDSGHAGFSVDSYEFRHLVVAGSAKATLDAFGAPVFSWIDVMRNASAVRSRTEIGAALVGEKEEGAHEYAGPFDLFIPGDLADTSDGSDNPERMPHLVLKYTPDGDVQQTADILLKDIPGITRWEPGVKYTYHINIRLDGGVIVTVITTEWDDAEAETPGLIIN